MNSSEVRFITRVAAGKESMRNLLVTLLGTAHQQILGWAELWQRWSGDDREDFTRMGLLIAGQITGDGLPLGPRR